MIRYYTDGSCSPNPGPGGFSVIKDMQPAILGGAKASTNIRMEGEALAAAMKDADGAECEIYSDSEFWIKTITEWAPKWEANGWQRKGGIKNLDLVQELVTLHRASQAKLIWVRGHNQDDGNELADEWANKARQQGLTAPKHL